MATFTSFDNIKVLKQHSHLLQKTKMIGLSWFSKIRALLYKDRETANRIPPPGRPHKTVVFALLNFGINILQLI